MEFIINHWGELIIIPMLIFAGICWFKNEKRMAQNWLLTAVSEAEKEFGAKTGTLKLHHVYDWFISKFPTLAKFMTFEEFGKMVDTALEEMRHLIETNEAFKNYIEG